MQILDIEQRRAQEEDHYRRAFKHLQLELAVEGWNTALAALDYSRELHADTYRKNGLTPSHIHEVSIALDLFSYRQEFRACGLDAESVVCGGLVHDIPEKKHSGGVNWPEIALIADLKKCGVSEIQAIDITGLGFRLDKYEGLHKLPPEDYIGKMLEDPRCPLIKIFDRTDNIRTISGLPFERQMPYLIDTGRLLDQLAPVSRLYPQLEALMRHCSRQLRDMIDPLSDAYCCAQRGSTFMGNDLPRTALAQN